jgi:hypothetical protein
MRGNVLTIHFLTFQLIEILILMRGWFEVVGVGLESMKGRQPLDCGSPAAAFGSQPCWRIVAERLSLLG